MPERAREIWRQLGVTGAIDENWETALVWGGILSGTQTHPGDALFPRIELDPA